MLTKRSILLLLTLLILTSPLAAYTIYLKDGSRIISRGKYQVEGDKAIITLPNGTKTFIALSEIAVERTLEANEVDYGDAVVIGDEREVEPRAKAREERPNQPSLTDVARSNRALRASRDRPEEDDEPDAVGTTRHPRTPVGNVDLLRASRVPLSSVETGSLLSEVLRNQGVEDASIYEGTRSGRILIEFSTNSEAAVFRAIEASARALTELEQQRPEDVQALELFMATDQRQRAGQFVMTPSRARELLGRQIDLPGFYLRYVQF